MITQKCREQVYERTGGICENPDCPNGFKGGPKRFAFNGEWEWHHIYFKSQYRGTDRDSAWNGSLLCAYPCHRGAERRKCGDIVKVYRGVHMGNKSLDRFLKRMADKRKPEELRSEKIQRAPSKKDIKKREKTRTAAKIRRKKMLKDYKKKNNGLSPFQVEYRRQKEYKKSQNG